MGLNFKIRSFLWLLHNTTKSVQSDTDAAIYRAQSAKSANQAKQFIQGKPAPMANVTDRMIPGRSIEIPSRIYKPIEATDLPIICYFHGGGFVISDLDTHDTICRKLAAENKAIVVAVDYRLAPEHKFPAAVHDAYDATLWIAQHAEELGGDAKKLIVMGDSAGGNLAAATTLIAREQKAFNIAGQVLIYPTVDARLTSPSINKYAEGYLLTKQLMTWFLEQYKRNEKDVLNPHLSMILADDLSNLPPALVITAGYDPLKDEGKAYADRLKAEGNSVAYKDYPNLIHGFIQLGKLSNEIQDCYDLISSHVKQMCEPKSTVAAN